MWLAPNVVTLIGYVVNFIPTILVNVFYGSSLEGHVDSWYCWSIAFTYLFYVIMDCSDGKQARRTGSSSPVGMLFDHFCDATVSLLNSWTI